jgi:predicted ferric reductase
MRKNGIIISIMIFIGIPLLFYSVGDIPRRSSLKESISVITLLAFSFALGQAFFSRINPKVFKKNKKALVLKLHKISGYILTGILLAHPFLMLIPRFFEAGPRPVEAFMMILNTTNTTGVLLGIISWFLLLILGLTSLFRRYPGIKYKTWRIFHGLLSMAFITTASWHAIDLGRHTNLSMSIFIMLLASVGIVLLLRTHLTNYIKGRKSE